MQVHEVHALPCSCAMHSYCCRPCCCLLRRILRGQVRLAPLPGWQLASACTPVHCACPRNVQQTGFPVSPIAAAAWPPSSADLESRGRALQAHRALCAAALPGPPVFRGGQPEGRPLWRCAEAEAGLRGQPIRNRVPALSFAMRSSTASVQLCDAELSGNNPSSAKAVQWILTLPARWPFHAAGKRVWELRPGYGNLTDAARVDGGEAL